MSVQSGADPDYPFPLDNIAPTPVPDIELTPDRVDVTSTLYAHSVALGLLPDRVDVTSTLYAPAVALGLSPSTVEVTAITYPVQLVFQLTPARVDVTVSVFAPTVDVGTPLTDIVLTPFIIISRVLLFPAMQNIKVQRLRFEIWQGQDFAVTIPIHDISGLAVDLTNYAGEGSLRADYKDSGSPLLGTFEIQLVPNAWMDSAGTPGWNAEVRLDRTQTSELKATNLPTLQGRVDLWVDNDLNRQPFCFGAAVIRLVVTEDS